MARKISILKAALELVPMELIQFDENQPRRELQKQIQLPEES